MTQAEFLLDTVQHYNSKNCSVDSDRNLCVYHPTFQGTLGCGIGRHLPENVQIIYDAQPIGSINKIFENPELKALSPDWMQAMDIRFLQSIQELHDSDSNWNVDGITKKGREKAQEISDWFNLGLTIQPTDAQP